MPHKKTVIDMRSRKTKAKEPKQMNTLTTMFKKIKSSGDEKETNTSDGDTVKNREVGLKPYDDTEMEPVNEVKPIQEEDKEADTSDEEIIVSNPPIILDEDFTPAVVKTESLLDNRDEPTAELTNSQILDTLSDEEIGFVEGDDQVRLMNTLIGNE